MNKSIAVALLLLTTCTRTPAPGLGALPPSAFEVGKAYHGFLLQKTLDFPELGARALYFVHTKSGAPLVKLESADANKVFAIGFKTPPESDTGLPHILEHAVLNGSKNFPVKSPFDILMQGSLNTFLNAFTGDDHTMYPVASTNAKDFKNLMHVYLDAVFYPRIFEDERIFEQEGWRYELESKDGPLTYNGVVYNEMKGAYSSPERVLFLNIGRQLFPETAYRYSSGGVPEAIVELTRDDFLAFHKKYCHPSNSYIYLYGDGDTAEELAFIDGQYLSAFIRQPADVTIAEQKSFSEPAVAEVPYPVASAEETANKTYLSFSWVLGGAAQPVESLLLDTLSDLLVNLPGAPVREALVEAGIGGDFSAYYDDLKQGVFAIIVEKAELADRERFQEVVTETLARVAAEGLDRRQVEGVLNTKEFSLREADYGGFPKGLVYGMRGMDGWMFSDDPLATFGFEETLAAAKQAIAAGRLEALIREGLLGNTHAAAVAVFPKPGMQEELNRALEEKLAGIKAGMSDEQIAALVERTAALKTWQKTPGPPELVAKVPMLSLADLDERGKAETVVDEKIGDTRVLFAPQTTSGITYVKHLFGVQSVPADKLVYLSLFSHLLGELSTKKHGYGELTTEINIHTGGIQTALEVFPSTDDASQYRPSFALSGKALTPKLGELLGLQAEIAQETLFDDRARLKEVVMQVHARMQGMARNAGHILAARRLASTVSPPGWFQEQTQGLTYVQFIAGLAEDFDARADELVAELIAIRDQVIRRPSHTVALVGDQAELDALRAQLPSFVTGLAPEAAPEQNWAWSPVKKAEGLLSASKVQYVAQGANYRTLGFAYSGRLELLRNILSRDFLQQKVRVENGAYGAWASFNRSGLGYFSSYRDPQLEKTIAVYSQVAEFVKGFDADERSMTRYIIGTIAGRDKPYPPRVEGMDAIDNLLTGVTNELRQRERQEILNAKPADIQALAPVVEKMIANANLCVYGNEELLQKNKALFGSLVPVIE